MKSTSDHLRIDIIDDDHALARSLALQLEVNGHHVSYVYRAKEGLQKIQDNCPDLLLLDLTLPDMSGLDLLQIFAQDFPDLPIIVISGRQDMESTIKAIKLGAFDYIRKPLDMDAVFLAIEKVKKIRPPASEQISTDKSTDLPKAFSRREIIGNHPRMIEILKQIGLLSRNDVSVFISGASGSGKELVARALHESSRPDTPFIPINCSALVDNLLESELFGYRKGAFTGANEDRAGKLESAQNGTLFFDEIGEMSLQLQSRLLRVLQEKEFEPVGSSASKPFLARAVFATHRNLLEMVHAGSFREDLYYRIAVARIEIPDLTERASDIPALAEFLLKKMRQEQGIDVKGFSPQALEILNKHSWPGNVRELENTLLRSAAMAPGEILEVEDIQFEKSQPTKNILNEIFPASVPEKTLDEMEKEFIEKLLKQKDFNITQTAKTLDISPTTLRKKIRDYEIE